LHSRRKECARIRNGRRRNADCQSCERQSVSSCHLLVPSVCAGPFLRPKILRFAYRCRFDRNQLKTPWVNPLSAAKTEDARPRSPNVHPLRNHRRLRPAESARAAGARSPDRRAMAAVRRRSLDPSGEQRRALEILANSPRGRTVRLLAEDRAGRIRRREAGDCESGRPNPQYAIGLATLPKSRSFSITLTISRKISAPKHIITAASHLNRPRTAMFITRRKRRSPVLSLGPSGRHLAWASQLSGCPRSRIRRRYWPGGPWRRRCPAVHRRPFRS
jgi:hypothetical protein